MSDIRSTSRSLRIAAHISASEWGGAERRSLVLLSELAARGHVVRVFCNTSFIADRARDAGLDAVISPLRGDVALHHALSLAARLREFRPDTLILVTFRRLLPGGLAARLARVRHVVARVGLASDVARSAKYRFVLQRWVDDVVVNAESLVEPFTASLPPHARVTVSAIPNGITARTALLSREEARAALGVPPAAFVVGTVARLVRQKRVDRIVRIVHALRAHNVHAVIAGSGYEREPLLRLARELGVDERVHLLGHREDIGVVHGALDLYVVSSDQEGMSSGMLEALASGVPVVSTPVSGAAEVLAGPEPAGVIAAADDVSLTDAVRRLLEEPERRRQLAGNAADIVARRYGVARMVDGWERLLLARNR